MKIELKLALLLVLGLLFNSVAVADEDESDEATMTVVDDADKADSIIVLPENAAEAALENAAFGIDTANSARELGREFGRQISESARAGTLTEHVRNGFVEEKRSGGQANSRRPGGD